MEFILLGARAAVGIYIIILFARAILSWFPVEPGSPVARINEFLIRVTEPALVPLRKVIPRAGMLDLSFLVLMFALLLVFSLLGGVG